MLLDDEIAGSMNSLSWNDREVFNVVDNVGTMLSQTKYFFQSMEAHVLKVISFVESNSWRRTKTLLCPCKESRKPRVLLLGPTGILLVNIVANTVNFGLGIKHGTKQFDFSEKYRAALRNKLSEIKL